MSRRVIETWLPIGAPVVRLSPRAPPSSRRCCPLTPTATGSCTCWGFTGIRWRAQEALAERAGLHWTYVRGVERGKRNPGLNTLAALAVALEVALANLVGSLERWAARFYSATLQAGQPFSSCLSPVHSECLADY
jgi:hypothetical protein